MSRTRLCSALLAATLVLSVQAQQPPAEGKPAPQAAPPQAQSAPKPPKPPRPTKARKYPKAKVPVDKLVDLNHASKEALMKLPGVTAEFAAKIIAARPLTTKTSLVTRGVVPHDVYSRIKGLSYAGQTPPTR